MTITLSEQVKGRVISSTITIRLVPPNDAITMSELGSTDFAMQLGSGIISEAINLLRMAAEKEGFRVEVNTAFTLVY